ncbi:MAG: pyridoxamine 5'-phosphate oxidase family protein [Sulfuricurvum sp.]|nr:pyridoxamine 5'-phosphate oxidase family protein [Sulfuricurvum sp.]MDD5386753.1 pyridoxamine 5'-phosphate oxidase family protein [Sulfuricurvum sp.]
MNPKIEAFIANHHLLSLATCADELWCCSLFYAYNPEEITFIVATDTQTLHGNNVLKNHTVAGTVALETKTIGKIQGIQFCGNMTLCEESKGLYFAAFPFSRVMNPTLWEIRLDEIKMTDNTLGFGKKLLWKRSASNEAGFSSPGD